MRIGKLLAGLMAVGLFALPALACAAAKPAASAAATAYYAGDVATAAQLASASGDRWITGLADYRLGRYADAERAFQSLSADGKQTADLRAGAAYWAARTDAMLGQVSGAEAMLKLAARWPTTFYGMIGARHVQLLAYQPPPQTDQRYISFVTGGPSGAPAFTDAVVSSGDGVQRTGSFPVPQLTPLGGFTIYPALVYALVKQESGFNPRAVSSAGAMGLMQLMPGTARQTASISKVSAGSVMDSGVNLRLGQDYVAWLVNSGLQTYDMLCTIAAYNGGPGTVTKVAGRVGGYDNTLMIMESMPARETRDYVEKVMANYWTYSKQFGVQHPASLDALASGASQIDIRMDQYS